MSRQSSPPSVDRIDFIEEHIGTKLHGRVSDFRLLIGDDGLILRGRAHSYHAKQLAQHVVMEAFDMPIVANEIEVV